MENARLIDQIKEAFAEVKKPYNHFGIYTARAHDEYSEPSEEEVQLDRELDRYALTPQQMHECYTALTFLEPAGYHYYLPAYMILAINQETIKDKSLRDSIVFNSAEYALSPGSSDDLELNKYWEKRHKRFNRSQIEVIIQFLEYCKQMRSWNEVFYLEVIDYWKNRRNTT